jgi:hypothetical protein
MVGWPFPVSEDARVLLAPTAARLPQIPRLTGREDTTEKIQALKPDLILDYGTVSPRYAELAQGSWRSLEPVEFATLEWVDWFNNRCLLEPIGNMPAEAEECYYARTEDIALAA